MSKLQTTINKETNEITFTREFNAPRQLVWNAYADPKLLAQWWGPTGFETELRQFEFKEGGVWHYVMKGTGENFKGTEYENMEAPGKAFYEKIKEPELLVYKDYFVDASGKIQENMPVTVTTIHFEDHGDKTIVKMIGKYETAEDLQKVVDMGMEQGLVETLEKLDKVLEGLK
jgi:uncharacterized protein YndB with AHSA1/START domain